MSLTPTGQRQLSHQLAGTNPQQALVVARRIEEPWFRCQALSQVARYWPGEDFDPILREATKAADSQDDWYKRVTVSAWPIRAYLERGRQPPAKRLLERYAMEASSIENMGGRSQALLMIFQAAKPYDRSLWEPVFRALVQASEPALAWRQLRNIRDAAAMVAKDSPSLVEETLRRLSDEKTVTALKRDIENGKNADPRPFFWLD